VRVAVRLCEPVPLGYSVGVVDGLCVYDQVADGWTVGTDCEPLLVCVCVLRVRETALRLWLVTDGLTVRVCKEQLAVRVPGVAVVTDVVGLCVIVRCCERLSVGVSERALQVCDGVRVLQVAVRVASVWVMAGLIVKVTESTGLRVSDKVLVLVPVTVDRDSVMLCDCE